MRPAPIAVVLAALLAAQAGAVAATDTPEPDGIAEVVVDDLVIGEDEQRFGPMRSAGYPEDADEVIVELDLAVLEDRGVDASDATVELRDEDVEGATVEGATVDAGVVRLVFAPEDTGFAVDEFRLVGLDTSETQAAEGVAFDAAFSGGEAHVHSFDVVDPDSTTPTLSTGSFALDRDEHRIAVEDVQPAGEEMTIEVDVSALKSHGIGAGGLGVEADVDRATVREASASDGVATVVVEPDADAALIDVRIELSGFDGSDVDTEEAVHAESVTYEARIDGDPIDVEPFDVRSHTPTPVVDTGAAGPGEDVPAGVDEESAPDQSLGLVVPVVGIGFAAWLLLRR